MEEFLHVLKHAAKHTIELFPFLFLIYFLIELLESKNIFKFEKSKLLKGKASPAIGALFGSVPQCGFSVVSSELFSKRKISVAALIAVFIATSDEAIPIMLSDYKSIPALLVLIATKIILGILIGYLTMGLHKIFFKKSDNELSHMIQNIAAEHSDETLSNTTHDDEHEHHDDEHDNEHEEHEEKNHIHACCHHDLEDSKFDWKHPLIHCLKITLYILIINIILEGLIVIIGESNLEKFLNSNHVLQPILALAVGLIPNCASSVVLTQLYISGGLSFGAIVTGLSVNAGLGLLVLLKENKNKKENLFVILMLIIPSLIFGYLLHFLPIDFLNF